MPRPKNKVTPVLPDSPLEDPLLDKVYVVDANSYLTLAVLYLPSLPRVGEWLWMDIPFLNPPRRRFRVMSVARRVWENELHECFTDVVVVVWDSGEEWPPWPNTP